MSTYHLQAEVNRIIEALELTGADMTIRCALREAYEAGKRRDPIDQTYNPLPPRLRPAPKRRR